MCGHSGTCMDHRTASNLRSPPSHCVASMPSSLVARTMSGAESTPTTDAPASAIFTVSAPSPQPRSSTCGGLLNDGISGTMVQMCVLCASGAELQCVGIQLAQLQAEMVPIGSGRQFVIGRCMICHSEDTLQSV
jgi:hypothetical protein